MLLAVFQLSYNAVCQEDSKYIVVLFRLSIVTQIVGCPVLLSWLVLLVSINKLFIIKVPVTVD